MIISNLPINIWQISYRLILKYPTKSKCADVPREQNSHMIAEKPRFPAFLPGITESAAG